MAKAHNSRLVEARRKARELATAQQERHEKLLTLAEEYFLSLDEADTVMTTAKETADKILADAKTKAAAVIADAETALADKQTQARLVITKMVDTDASIADVADRLGITKAAVTKALKAASAAAAGDDAGPATATSMPSQTSGDALVQDGAAA